MDTLLMMKDIPVMRVNVDEGKYEILNERLIPFVLQDRFLKIRPFEELHSQYDYTQNTIAMNKNRDAFISFLSCRTLPLSRENAKKIYQLFNFDQVQSDENKARIALICRAVSLQDNYWVKSEGDPVCWRDVNLRENSLNEIVTQVALHGSGLSLTGKDDFMTPELTNLGAYAKGWMREFDGLYLHKLGSAIGGEKDSPTLGSWESKVEVMCSGLLDCMNVEHIKYIPGQIVNPRTKEEMYTCKCKCMTTENVSMLSGMDFITYCNVHHLDPFDAALHLDGENIYKMWIVDYLLSNRDRHTLNWGFFYECNENKILKCHPLFDHNNCFDVETMADKNRPYLYDSCMTMKEAAKTAMRHVDFYFTRPITRDMFLTERMYESFKDRAKDLGLDLDKPRTWDNPLDHEEPSEDAEETLNR